MADGCTTFRVPNMNQKSFNRKDKIEGMTAHPTNASKNINCSGKYNNQNDKIHVIHNCFKKSY